MFISLKRFLEDSLGIGDMAPVILLRKYDGNVVVWLKYSRFSKGFLSVVIPEVDVFNQRFSCWHMYNVHGKFASHKFVFIASGTVFESV